MSNGQTLIDYATIDFPAPLPGQPEPAWLLATMWPCQGHWSENDYLELTQTSNCLAELTAGRLEVLPMPTLSHQLLADWLRDALKQFTRPGKLGIAVSAPLRVRLREGEIREPDVVFMLSENRERAGEDCFDGADLVIEVVSKDKKSRHRDYVEKRVEYATAGIPEYWIVDPQENKITVLTLPDGADAYAEHGVFTPGQAATSQLLEGFSVDVKSAFDAAKP